MAGDSELIPCGSAIALASRQAFTSSISASDLSPARSTLLQSPRGGGAAVVCSGWAGACCCALAAIGKRKAAARNTSERNIPIPYRPGLICLGRPYPDGGRAQVLASRKGTGADSPVKRLCGSPSAENGRERRLP